MESNITPNSKDTQVTVDVPEDRVAEFHAFFARFLAGPSRRRGGRRGRHAHGHGHGHHGRGCGQRSQSAERPEQSAERPDQSAETTEI
jgi:hypothetical protein